MTDLVSLARGAVLFIYASLILAASPAGADDCDVLVDRLVTAVPGLKLDRRVRVSDYFDNFILQNQNAPEQIIVTCGPKFLFFLFKR
jgi:hypothetical protein